MTSAVFSEMVVRAPMLMVISIVPIYAIAYLLGVLVNLLHHDEKRRADAARFLAQHPLTIRRRRGR
ncbi:hypothetical protein E0500_028510 [Streptomyces sp. KM273126]|uniref:hypothetical protein n=1 Tax=Streptomyces sp. KM273126 TaxID=2545247 RepID=UPI001040129D|nr:hypothetical protein [Streptomyces sp. KM273126]MBA2811238.1 hypothetical protein [Streptomyces sp. KM273126]